MNRFSIGKLIFAVAIPLIVGGASAALSSKGMAMYGTMDKPPLSPPAWLFSVAWTILYIMMGLASYFVIMSDVDTGNKKLVIILYVIQLAMNFMWSIVFFNWGMYLFAFIWLMIMWCIVIVCAICAHNVSRVAAWLLVPYILWLTFAAYLNIGAYILSRK